MSGSRPTSAHVAARAGVSRTTVSFVLNARTDAHISTETRERVLQAAADLGYHPQAAARQLAGGRSHVIGLVLRQTPDQVARDGTLAETLRGLAVAARSADSRVMVESEPREGSYDRLLRAQHADGLIVSGPRLDEPSLKRLAAEGYPIVLQGSVPGLETPTVDIDNVDGARSAVEHLLRLGHRRIACITNAPLTYTSARERVTGYRDALSSAGVDWDERLVVEGGFAPASAEQATELLLKQQPFTALFVASDVLVLGVLASLGTAGLRVPDDVSVVGFDDVPLAAYFNPPLTTVRLPAFELGQAAGRVLLDRIAGRAVPQRTLLPTQLIVRGSTAPPPSHRNLA